MHGVTWYVHAVLNRVYQEVEKPITQRLIDKVVRELVEEQSPVFQNYYNAMTVNQAAVAVAIAREQKVAKPLSQDFIARYRLPSPSSVQTSLEKLEANQIVLRNSSGYFIYDHFFAMWLRNLA